MCVSHYGCIENDMLVILDLFLEFCPQERLCLLVTNGASLFFFFLNISK